MGTEILQPHALLAEIFHVAAPAFQWRSFPANGELTNLLVKRRPSINSRNKKSPKPDRRKSKSPETKRVSHAGDLRRKDGNSGPTMGKVTILRRGQSIDSLAPKLNRGNARSKSPPAKLSAADDMVVPKQIRLSPPPPFPDVYAGSVVLSPSPRSLPHPSFPNMKQQIKPSDDPATRDLRRLLRLE